MGRTPAKNRKVGFTSLLTVTVAAGFISETVRCPFVKINKINGHLIVLAPDSNVSLPGWEFSSQSALNSMSLYRKGESSPPPTTATDGTVVSYAFPCFI